VALLFTEFAQAVRLSQWLISFVKMVALEAGEFGPEECTFTSSCKPPSTFNGPDGYPYQWSPSTDNQDLLVSGVSAKYATKCLPLICR
jgi:hypothetical protein